MGAVRGQTIVLDPGHNVGNWTDPAAINQHVFVGNGYKACDTTGTETDSGYTEAAFTFDVATRMTALLQAAGANVMLTRTNNTGVGPCVNQRAEIANKARATVALSIHGDGNPPGGRGFQVLEPAPIPGYNTVIVAPRTAWRWMCGRTTRQRLASRSRPTTGPTPSPCAATSAA
ncbi:MAG: N-acetylmuramoyl-L-alanine amidase family protein [Acidimicrobiales bacterium]